MCRHLTTYTPCECLFWYPGSGNTTWSRSRTSWMSGWRCKRPGSTSNRYSVRRTSWPRCPRKADVLQQSIKIGATSWNRRTSINTSCPSSRLTRFSTSCGSQMNSLSSFRRQGSNFWSFLFRNTYIYRFKIIYYWFIDLLFQFKLFVFLGFEWLSREEASVFPPILLPVQRWIARDFVRNKRSYKVSLNNWNIIHALF